MLGRARHPNTTSKAVAAKSTLTMQRLLRQAAWGCAAAAALFVAVLTAAATSVRNEPRRHLVP